MIGRLREDVAATIERDPGSGGLELLLAYPGLHAVWCHRIANRLWNRDFRLTARLLSHLVR